jgi:hypothetical protein
MINNGYFGIKVLVSRRAKPRMGKLPDEQNPFYFTPAEEPALKSMGGDVDSAVQKEKR